MKTITLSLYQFDEFGKEAKQKALTTYKELNVDFDWWDTYYEDFIQLCAYLGITVDKNSIKFEGFYSQGDGSAFSATVDLAKLKEAAESQAWKAYAPKQEFDFKGLNIERRVMALIANGILQEEIKVIARYRSYGIVVDLGIYIVNESKDHNNIFDALENAEAWLRDIATKLNRYLYQSLQNQFEYLTSDEAIAEIVKANEYLFTADGRSANYLDKLSQFTNT
jgi:hypothetical protein